MRVIPKVVPWRAYPHAHPCTWTALSPNLSPHHCLASCLKHRFQLKPCLLSLLNDSVRQSVIIGWETKLLKHKEKQFLSSVGWCPKQLLMGKPGQSKGMVHRFFVSLIPCTVFISERNTVRRLSCFQNSQEGKGRMNRWLHYVQDIAWAFIIIFFHRK